MNLFNNLIDSSEKEPFKKVYYMLKMVKIISCGMMKGKNFGLMLKILM